MPLPNSEHMFLQKLDEQLWGSAQKLRQSLDAANYKHVVLTLIFIKFLCDQKERLSFSFPDSFDWEAIKKSPTMTYTIATLKPRFCKPILRVQPRRDAFP